ncbi:MAG: class I SAM-dependent methyltransferase [Rhodospirillales bacterium]|nr:class I SAM-dependent methyltransferase [Alphaproteobacteria bacterium]MBL6948511.1 class I SAM-dependent methyltransferase [Rhodospirillales bacterium]
MKEKTLPMETVGSALDNWKDIWSSKSAGYSIASDGSMTDLLRLDGFDSGMGYISPENWFEYVRQTCETIGLATDDEFLEVGCGAGAFMHALSPCPRIQVGVDYSANQIKMAKEFKSEQMMFFEKDANDIHTLEKKFDVVLVNSVIQYFPSMDYFLEFFGKVVAVLRDGGRGCVLDINDIEKKDEYTRRRYIEHGGKKKYLENYKGLKHAFYSREQILEILERLGVGSVRIEDQFIRNCRVSEFRFNVFFEK